MVHLGIATTGDVIVKMLLVLVDHLHLQRIVFFPQVLQGGETLQIRAIWLLRGEVFAGFNGGIFNCLANHRLCALFADLAHQDLVDRFDDFRFYAAPCQNTQLVFCIAHRLAPHCLRIFIVFLRRPIRSAAAICRQPPDTG